MTRCYLCGGALQSGRVTAREWRDGKLTLIENVPALVCENCGEPYFDAETCRQMDRVMETAETPSRTIEVPVYAFSS